MGGREEGCWDGDLPADRVVGEEMDSLLWRMQSNDVRDTLPRRWRRRALEQDLRYLHRF